MRALFCLLLILPGIAAATPCDGLDRSKSLGGNTQVAELIAKQRQLDKLEILGSISSGGWTVIHAQPAHAEALYLFYAGDIASSSAVAEWSGAAAPDEAQQIRAWTLQKVPGIPPLLADCFAARVSERNAL
ncbi:MAG: hypothetical protein ABI411_04000 [Tahibacter sp.]